jgi:hypothetical protein
VRKRKGSLYTPDDVDPRQRAAIPSKEDFDTSPHYPLVMTPDPMSASDGQVTQAVAGAACSSSKDPCGRTTQQPPHTTAVRHPVSDSSRNSAASCFDVDPMPPGSCWVP